MNKLIAGILAIEVGLSAQAAGRDQIVTMDDEPHYSRVFSNEYCRAYFVNIGRLEETKPIVHQHDWVRMTLDGTDEQAWGGTAYSSARYKDADDYRISFHYPVSRVSRRNPRVKPYFALIVEIMGDDSRDRQRDLSLSPFSQRLSSGADPHASYVTTLTETSVEITSVQLLGGDSKELHSPGEGALIIAMTDINLSRQQRGVDSKELRLSKGDVHWFPGAAPTFKNLDRNPARFVVLEMK
jgi:hypothetical protein